MKRIALSALLALAFGHTAFATVSLELISGANSVTVTDNSAGDLNPTAGLILYSNPSFNGWDISFAGGRSNAPSNLPYGLDLSSLTATCNSSDPGCTGAVLEIDLSDTGFTGPSTLVNTYSATTTGQNAGTAQFVYFNNGVPASPNGNLFSKATVVCEVGPFTGGGSHSATSCSGPATGSVYSETLAQFFSAQYCPDCAPGAVSFSVDGNVTAVPEPGSIVMLGTVLLGVSQLIRRRSQKA